MVAPKLSLANLPTPLFRHEALDRLVGAAVWVKRDDMTGGVETGNKVRKLEYLLADAQQKGTTFVLTCGGLQSNHCRATAVLARRLGMRVRLLLRCAEPPPPLPVGNAFLDRLVGAEVQVISPADYARRDALMADIADELSLRGERVYVIPEGGSNGLGALGYVDAMAELRAQLDGGGQELPARFDVVAFACGSGGTAAGVGLGIAAEDLADAAWAYAVCDDEAYFRARVDGICHEAMALRPDLKAAGAIEIWDEHRGPAYGVASPEQLAFIVTVARTTGLMLDPVYTGKALFGLAHTSDKPQSVCFIHTGGLPGLLAESATLAQVPGF